MTDRGAPASASADPAARPRPRRGPGAFGVAVLTVGAFLAFFTLLATRMGQGQDPALGAGGTSRRAVIVRRIEVRRVVEHPARAAAAGPSRVGFDATPSRATPPVPQSTRSAPAPAAATAPAPAPVSTGSS